VVIRRLALGLVRSAARRWPEGRRDELRREWEAELHVLGEEGRSWPILRYSTSLALSRGPDGAGVSLRSAWRVARLAVVLPAAALLVFVAAVRAVLAVLLILERLQIRQPDRSMQLAQAGLAALCIAGAVVLARLGRRWTLPGSRAALVAAVTLPGFGLSAGIYFWSGPRVGFEALPAVAVAFAGLAALLWWTDRAPLPRPWAVVAGIAVLADLATIVHELSLGLGDYADSDPPVWGAPLWLFTALTGSRLHLPHLDFSQASALADATGLTPMLFILFAGLGAGAVLGRRELGPAL
jgi:hypothetical protein